MLQTQQPPVISIVGKPKVGKTTFLTRLIAELTARGYRVGVIKHSIHSFAVAEPGRDTWKHAQAGAETVAFASADQLVITRALQNEMDIDEIAALMGKLDLILTEGYKHAHKPKIEVSRRELGTDLVGRRQELVALVSDHELDLGIPSYALDDAAGVAEFLCARFLS